jgi:hypothetical protein
MYQWNLESLVEALSGDDPRLFRSFGTKLLRGAQS